MLNHVTEVLDLALEQVTLIYSKGTPGPFQCDTYFINVANMAVHIFLEDNDLYK